MSDERYYDESLCPPPESSDGDRKVDSWDWGEALIDVEAYMIKDCNHTTARCTFDDKTENEELQVTFRLAPPPHISYFCIGYTSGKPTEFIKEPKIIAMEDNLALIKLMHGSTHPSKCNYFVHQAPIHRDELPNLRQLPHPNPDLFLPSFDCFFDESALGIVRYSTKRRSELGPFKSNSDDCDAYKIASLCRRFEAAGAEYDLYIYDSNVNAWTRKATAFSQPPPEDTRTHLIDKVITISYAMGWADLEHGILLCDVHVPGKEKENPNPRLLRYIPLPEPRQPDNHLPLCGTSSFFRDIVVVQDSIKFVDLQVHASPGSQIPNGWMVVTWSMKLSDSGFSEESELHSRDIDSPLEPSLFVGHPTLSSHHDGILYLMTQVGRHNQVSRVIAVNMKTKKLEGVAKFTTQRNASMNFAYRRTTISTYLNQAISNLFILPSPQHA